ncbi:MAG: metallopeptidase family protein [Planctomycetes bacterium]|nr:metallopeptidase family protein [Planctomycetota bacterium]
MVRVSAQVFDAVLHDVIASLPEPFAELLERVPVIVDPRPSRELRRSVEDADDLLGLYLGPSIAEWDRSEGPPETSVIFLFQEHLERACATRDELFEQIRITLLHELGHALGFDEDGLDRIGLG